MKTNENNTTPEITIPTPSIDIHNMANPTPSPPTNDETKKNLSERLKDTANSAKQARQTKVKIPTGTKLEDYYKEYEKEPLKKKRGRPKKYPNGVDDYIKEKQAQETAPPPVNEKPKVISVKEAGGVDLISPAINMMVCPIIAEQYNIDADKIIYSDKELDYLSTIQPQSQMLNQPNWWTFGIVAVSMLMMKVFKEKNLKIKDEQAKQMEDKIKKHERFIKVGVDENGVTTMEKA